MTVKRSTTLAIFAVIASFVAVLGLHACDTATTVNPNRPDGVATSPRHPVRPIGPTRTTRGVPGGWRHDRAGAKAAAASAVHLTGAIAKAGFITRSDMIHQLTTERFGPALARTSANQLDQLMSEAGSESITPGQLLWDEIPLTATVTRSTATTASVRVWSVAVVGAPGVGVPRQAWRIVTVTLAWEGGDWRVDGWTARPGPAPTLADSTVTASFDALREVTGWPLAVEEGGN